MAVITNRVNLVEELLKNPPSAGALRRLIRQASTEMVLDSNKSRSEWKKILASIGSQGSLDNLLEGFIDLLVTCDGGGEIEDRRLAKVEADSLEALFDSEKWLDAVEEHQGNTKNSEPRDEAFGRFFGHLLAPKDSELQIFDPYFLSKALKGEEVIDWLFSQLAPRGEQRLTIWTQVSSEQALEGTSTDISRKFCQTVYERLSHWGFQGSVKLKVFDKHPHDRYVAIRFTNGRVAFPLGYGVDLFRNAKIEETAPVLPISDRDLSSVLKNGGFRPSQYQFSMLETQESAQVKVELHLPDHWAREA